MQEANLKHKKINQNKTELKSILYKDSFKVKSI